MADAGWRRYAIPGYISTAAKHGISTPVVLRIDIAGQLHHSNLRVRPPRRPRRTFWQW